MFEPENVLRSIDVTVVNRAAVAALPFSHSEVFQSSRTADAAAIGTNLGRQPLSSLLVLHPVPSGLVAELRSEKRPAGVEHGFRHPCACQLGGIDIADDNARIGANQTRRLAVEVMPPSSGDLAMDGAGVPLAPSALRPSKLTSPLSKVASVRNPRSVGTRRKCGEPEIDPDCWTLADWLRVFDFDLKAEEPTAAGIASDAASADVGIDRTALPEAVAFAEMYYDIAIEFDGTRCGEWHPAERLLATPSRALPLRVAAGDELFADGLHRIAVQSKQTAAAGRQLDQIKGRRPAFVMPSRSLLDFAAIVPDPVYRSRKRSELLSARSVFDAISVGQQHGRIVVQSAKKGASPPRPKGPGFRRETSR